MEMGRWTSGAWRIYVEADAEDDTRTIDRLFRAGRDHAFEDPSLGWKVRSLWLPHRKSTIRKSIRHTKERTRLERTRICLRPQNLNIDLDTVHEPVKQDIRPSSSSRTSAPLRRAFREGLLVFLAELMSRLRLRDLPSLPLLLFLHLIFTLSSLFLRFFQLFPPPSHDPTLTSRRVLPPRHIALVLSYPSSPKSLTHAFEARRALVESVSRAVRWAGEEGVEEMSIWDGRGTSHPCVLRVSPSDGAGRIVTHLPRLARADSTPVTSIAAFVRRFITPSSSLYIRALCLSLIHVQSLMEKGRCEGRHEGRDDFHRLSADQYASSHPSTSIVTRPTDGEAEAKPVIVHLLPRSSSGPLLSHLARSYASSHTPTSSITRERLGADIQGKPPVSRLFSDGHADGLNE